MVWGDWDRIPSDLFPGSCGVAPAPDLTLPSGILTYDYKSPRVQDVINRLWPFKGSGYLTVCPQGWALQYQVTLKLTEDPPPWGRVGGDANGDPLPGFGCAGLLGRDNSYMEVVGSTVLHEFFQ